MRRSASFAAVESSSLRSHRSACLHAPAGPPLRSAAWRVAALCALACLAWPASAQSVVGTVSAGTGPNAVAANPLTGKVYIANNGDTTVIVIDGATNTTTAVTVGTSPAAVAVNPVTNLVYVANYDSNTVSVLDGATDTVTETIPVGLAPFALEVNSLTNMIYVANSGDNTVSVIDGVPGSVTATVTVGSTPAALALDPVTNVVYVANQGGSVSVIDGSSNSAITIPLSGSNPYALAVNPVTNTIYVTNPSGANVSVIDGGTNTVTATVSTGTTPHFVAVNPVKNKIYVTNATSNTVTVIDGATNNTATVNVGSTPLAIAVNSLTGQVYVLNHGSGTVSLMSGATNAVTATLTVGASPAAVAVNPVTNRAYVTNGNSNNVSVIDGAASTTSTATVGNSANAIAVNPVTNTFYVCNQAGNSVSVINGANGVVKATVPTGATPNAIAVNPVTNKVYVASVASNNVTVIDGASNTVKTTVSVGTGQTALAVNTATNKIYVANGGSSNSVTVIDGASDAVASTVSLAGSAAALAVNSKTNKVYVVLGGGSDSIPVIDGASDTVTDTVVAGTFSDAVVVNAVTNKIYLAAGGSAEVTVIDGATDTVTDTVTTASSPRTILVNPVTAKVYAAGNTSSAVTVIDGATDATTTVNLAGNPAVGGMALDPVTNRVYVLTPSSTTISVIDGPSDTASTLSLGSSSSSLAINPVTGKILATAPGAPGSPSKVILMDPNSYQAVPLTISTSGVSDSLTVSTTNVFQTLNPTPSFTASVTSAFASSSVYSSLTASNPPPTALYYSVDGNAWSETGPTTSPATNPAGFSITLPTQSIGLHTLYLYAAYGNEGGPNNGEASGNSPEIGNLAAYAFQIDSVTTSTALVADTDPQNAGSQVTFTATVTPITILAAGAPTGTVSFSDGTSPLCSVALQLNGSSYQAACSTSSLASGSHTIHAVYSGDANYPGSTGSLTEVIAGDPANIAIISGSGQSAGWGTALASPLVVQVNDSNNIPIPNVSVGFNDPGLNFSSNPAVTDASGEVSVTMTPTAPGTFGGTATTGALSANFTEYGLQQTTTFSWTPASTIIAGDSGAGVLNATANPSECSAYGTIAYTENQGGSSTPISNTSSLTPGTYSVTAYYNPNPQYCSIAVSTPITLTVSGESVWLVNSGGSTAELAGNGDAISSSAYSGANLAAAINATGDVWTIGAGATPLEATSQIGTVKHTVTGGGGLDTPSAIAVDGNSQLWITNSGNNSVSLFLNDGTVESPSTGFTDSSLSSPSGVAVDLGGSVWIANQGNNSITRILGAAAPAAPLSTAAKNNTTGAKP